MLSCLYHLHPLHVLRERHMLPSSHHIAMYTSNLIISFSQCLCNVSPSPVIHTYIYYAISANLREYKSPCNVEYTLDINTFIFMARKFMLSSCLWSCEAPLIRGSHGSCTAVTSHDALPTATHWQLPVPAASPEPNSLITANAGQTAVTEIYHTSDGNMWESGTQSSE